MIVVGAGMAGLLAAAMLRDEATEVIEQQDSLPNNHSAVLRFRSSIIADTLNIPFKKVKVYRGIVPWRNHVADSMSYSLKTNGSRTMRSILNADERMVDRFIAPPDLIRRMAAKVQCPISFGLSAEFTRDFTPKIPWVSTIPMPALMKQLNYHDIPDFNWKPGTNVIIQLANVSAYCSLYTPDPELPFARLSLTAHELIAECYDDIDLTENELHNLVLSAIYQFGISENEVMSVEQQSQRYAKILPIDERVRKHFIMWASENYNIYSLGRFATWRPGLLLDDLVQDVRVIQRLASGSEESYNQKRKA